MPDVEYDPTQVLLPKATARVSTHVLSDDEDQTVWPSGVPTAFTITLVISLLTLVVEVVDRAPMASRMVIFEDIICRNHYGLWEGGLGDCKIQPVQNELALVTGWKETFDNIPGARGESVSVCLGPLLIIIRLAGGNSIRNSGQSHRTR
jgi:hypothetical protein